MHECFFTARGLGKAMDIDPYEATDLTVISVTDAQVIVRKAVVS